MKKLFTDNHKNILTCNDFEIKFKHYLDYIELTNTHLYDLFSKKEDFSIQNINALKKNFNIFFEIWLKKAYNYNLIFDEQNITSFVDSFKTTDSGFSELFANFNFYKKINSAKETFFVYDITEDEEIKYNKIIKSNK